MSLRFFVGFIHEGTFQSYVLLHTVRIMNRASVSIPLNAWPDQSFLWFLKSALVHCFFVAPWWFCISYLLFHQSCTFLFLSWLLNQTKFLASCMCFWCCISLWSPPLQKPAPVSLKKSGKIMLSLDPFF